MQYAYLVYQQIEEMLTKDAIFERYLNVIELGEDLYGVKNASQAYFAKPASQLNVLEAAYLAYLLPNPKVYSQVYETSELTEFAEKRIRDILRLLHRFKRIEDNQLEVANQLVTRFPWYDLSADEQALLQGSSSDFNEPLEDELLPHFSSGEVSEDDSEDKQVSDIENEVGVEVTEEQSSDSL